MDPYIDKYDAPPARTTQMNSPKGVWHEAASTAVRADSTAVRMMDALDEFIRQSTANNIDLQCMANRCLYQPTQEQAEESPLAPCNDYTARFRTLGELLDKQRELIKKLTEYI